MERFLWNDTLVAREASKYRTRKEFKAFASGAYGYAQRNGLLDTVCEHMPEPKPMIIWSFEVLKNIASKYDNVSDFRVFEPTAYRASKRIGLYEQVVENIKDKSGKPRKALKKLAFYKKLDLDSLNETRLQVGLKPLKIRIRKCLVCGLEFESIEARTCGCVGRETTTRFDPLLN